MHVPPKVLNPLGSVPLSPEENTLLKWLRATSWQPVLDAQEPTLKTKVPEFYGGVRLYRMQAGGASAGSLGALELFIKKLSVLGVIGKQGLYPLEGHGNAGRYLSLKQTDLVNLGVGRQEEEEE